ncbi:tetratricopeptide repeat protein [Paracoccus zhejiangensis]|nr:tetratricopeptide repeat protein [Paracoccus zhejiangensis]
MDNAFVAEIEGGEGNAELLYREAKKRYQNADYLRAEEFLSRALAEQPERADWHALLAEISRRLGVNDAAIDSYRRAVDLQNEPRHRVGLAQVLAAAGRVEEAEQEFQQVLRVDPNNSAATYALGRHRYRQGQFDEAERLLMLTLASDPENAGAHRVLAQLYDARGNHPQALSHHAAVARLLPENTSFLLGYARSQRRNADTFGAEATYRRILSLDPDNSAARTDLERLK